MDWTAFSTALGVLSAITGGIVTASTVYLKLFVGQQVGRAKDEIMEAVRKHSYDRSLLDERFDNIEKRFAGVDRRIDHIEGRPRRPS